MPQLIHGAVVWKTLAVSCLGGPSRKVDERGGSNVKLIRPLGARSWFDLMYVCMPIPKFEKCKVDMQKEAGSTEFN